MKTKQYATLILTSSTFFVLETLESMLIVCLVGVILVKKYIWAGKKIRVAGRLKENTNVSTCHTADGPKSSC